MNTNKWQRWQPTDNYYTTEYIELLFVDNQNRVCLKKEKTKDIVWNRQEDLILAWRPVIKSQEEKVKKEPDVMMVKYWNYITRKYWSSDKVKPNPKLPNYLKVTFMLTDGKLEVKYEMHSQR